MKVTETTINGRVFDVSVTEAGQFYSSFSGENIYAETLPKLKTKLKMKMDQAKVVRIPATIYNDDHWRGEKDRLVLTNVTLTGIHAGRYADITYRDSKGRADECGERSVLRRLTEDEAVKLTAAYKAKQDAERAYQNLLKTYKLDAKREIERAAVLESSEV